MELIRRVFIKRQVSIASAALILMLTVLASRILGLMRDRMLAGRFTPDELGVYFAAFRLPDMLFELLVMGALTTAFIPVFTKLLTNEKEQTAWGMASVVINYGFLVLAVLTVPVLIFAEPICRLFAPGFSQDQISQMALFTRIMVIFQVYPLMLGNFLTGMLQSYQIFFIPALAPVLYNTGIILGVYFLSTSVGLFAPVIGVILGSFLFLGIQIPAIVILKFRHRFSLDINTPGVKEVGKQMLPRTLGLAISQIDSTVDLALSSLLGSKMITVFQFAQQLQQVPIGLFGITIAQAALPALSREVAKNEKYMFRRQLVSAIHQILFFILPFSVFFFVLRIPITRIIYGSHEFDWESTVLTGQTLSAFSISLFAQATVQVLVRGFYAYYDVSTPVIVGIINIVINSVLSVIFVTLLKLPVWSLGLSTSIASIVQALVLVILLQRRVGNFSFTDVVWVPFKMSLAAILMGIVSFGLLRLLDQLVFDTTRTLNLVMLTGTVGLIGFSLYLFLSWVFAVDQVSSFFRLLKKLNRVRSITSWTVSATEGKEGKQHP